jgi:hypothetical protein
LQALGCAIIKNRRSNRSRGSARGDRKEEARKIKVTHGRCATRKLQRK